MDRKETVEGYEIKRAVVFDNNRGFALGENPNVPQQFVTWQLTEYEDGKRDYYWGHYTKDGDRAAKDFKSRVSQYRKEYGASIKSKWPAPPDKSPDRVKPPTEKKRGRERDR